MNTSFEPKKLVGTQACRTVLDRLKALYDEMDREYESVAGQYGFHCSGCTDNCCLTRFHHHTFIEYIYIYTGFQTLEPPVQKQVRQRAHEVCLATESADLKGETPHIMCPLNMAGRCRVYAHRPMICRLHGIPHELRRPGRDTVYHTGCDECTQLTKGKAYIPFDRTPFYIHMARLEKEFRQEIGIQLRIKMTVAQMIETF